MAIQGNQQGGNDLPPNLRDVDKRLKSSGIGGFVAREKQKQALNEDAGKKLQQLFPVMANFVQGGNIDAANNVAESIRRDPNPKLSNLFPPGFKILS